MMKKLKMLWMPVLLGALLMSTLVGVAAARPNARPEASPALVDYMFSAHRCFSTDPTYDPHYVAMHLECDSGICHFVCPIKPPHEGLIRVQRLALYAFDNLSGDVCIDLRHVYPKTGINQCTANSATDPQVISYNPANFKVSVLQDLIAWVSIDSNGQKLYGFKLKYEPL
jgi:hypothetical protein